MAREQLGDIRRNVLFRRLGYLLRLVPVHGELCPQLCHFEKG
jgi:hypothetical protein